MKKDDKHKKIKKNITIDEPVRIDETDFDRCILIDPVILYDGKPFSFENTKIYGDVTLQSKNETVRNTIELLDFLGFLTKDFSEKWSKAE